MTVVLRMEGTPRLSSSGRANRAPTDGVGTHKPRSPFAASLRTFGPSAHHSGPLAGREAGSSPGRSRLRVAGVMGVRGTQARMPVLRGRAGVGSRALSCAIAVEGSRGDGGEGATGKIACVTRTRR